MHRVTVKMNGGGAIRGAVRTEPGGIYCALAFEDENGRECFADFAGGKLALSFEPDGASSVAQFSVVRGDKREMCEGQMGAMKCTLDLDGDVRVEVFPISVPPPPPSSQ
jgi:hypothetical protein